MASPATRTTPLAWAAGPGASDQFRFNGAHRRLLTRLARRVWQRCTPSAEDERATALGLLVGHRRFGGRRYRDPRFTPERTHP